MGKKMGGGKGGGTQVNVISVYLSNTISEEEIQSISSALI